MSRTTRFLGGISFGYAHQIAVTVVGLWLTPFFLRRLGAHDYGLWLTATQIVAYLMLLDFGVLALLPRETAYATGRSGGVHQATDLSDVVGRTARFVLWQMPLIAIAAISAWWLIPATWEGLKAPLAWLLAAFVLTYPLRISQAALQGVQDLAFVAGVQLAAWGVGTAMTVLLVVGGSGLKALAAGAIVTQLVSLGGCAYRIVTRFPAALPRRLPDLTWEDAAPYLQRSLWVSVSQLAQVMLYATDLLIVAWVFGPVAVVPYACTQKLISVLSNQPQLLTQAAAPALSELRVESTREKLFSVTSSLSLALMLASGAVCVVVLGVNRAFVSWWVGADQYGGAVLTTLFVTAMLVRHWNTALVYSLFAFGHERRLSLTTIADGVVTLATSVMLARAIGVVGVPLGFLAGALLVSIPANLRALARETDVTPLQYLAVLRPWALRLAMLVPVAVAANLIVRPGQFAPVVIVAVVMGIAYAALMLRMALRPPLGEYVRRGLGPVFGFRVAGLKPRATAAADATVVARGFSRASAIDDVLNR
jgi:O-antigen/teichoic acid export membrane protein